MKLRNQKFSEEQVLIRPMVADDYNFIKDSWLKSVRSNPEFRYMKDEIFYPHNDPIISSILSNPLTIIKIAAFSEDPNIIIGFIVYFVSRVPIPPHPDDYIVIHWASVKKTFREMGFFSYMLENINTATPIPKKFFFTYLPQDKYDFVTKQEFKRRGLIYNPYLREEFISPIKYNHEG